MCVRVCAYMYECVRPVVNMNYKMHAYAHIQVNDYVVLQASKVILYEILSIAALSECVINELFI